MGGKEGLRNKKMIKYLLCFLIFTLSVHANPFNWGHSDTKIKIQKAGLQVNAILFLNKKNMLKLSSGEVYFFYAQEDKKVQRWKRGDPLSIQGYKKCIIYNLRTHEEIKAVLQHI